MEIVFPVASGLYMSEIGTIGKVSLSYGLGFYPTGGSIHRLARRKDLTQSAMTGCLESGLGSWVLAF